MKKSKGKAIKKIKIFSFYLLLICILPMAFTTIVQYNYISITTLTYITCGLWGAACVNSIISYKVQKENNFQLEMINDLLKLIDIQLTKNFKEKYKQSLKKGKTK